MSITPAQCRAARGLLNWSQGRLATEARICRATVTYFESEQRSVLDQSISAMRMALETGGILFLRHYGEAGVAFRAPPPAISGLHSAQAGARA